MTQLDQFYPIRQKVRKNARLTAGKGCFAIKKW